MSALCILILAGTSAAWAQSVEDRARDFLQKFDVNASDLMYQYSLASWAYNTNITAENSDKLVSAVINVFLRFCQLYLTYFLINMILFVAAINGRIFDANLTGSLF